MLTKSVEQDCELSLNDRGACGCVHTGVVQILGADGYAFNRGRGKQEAAAAVCAHGVLYQVGAGGEAVQVDVHAVGGLRGVEVDGGEVGVKGFRHVAVAMASGGAGGGGSLFDHPPPGGGHTRAAAARGFWRGQGASRVRRLRVTAERRLEVQ